MASGLHKLIHEVKGEVKLQTSSVIQQTSTYQQGALRLSQLGDTYHIQCVHYIGKGKLSKRYKLDRQQLTEAKLVARDGRLTVYLPAHSRARFDLQKSTENEIEAFISHLDKIKRIVLTQAAAKSKRPVGVITPIPRVETLFGPKESASTPTSFRKGSGHQNGVHRTPQKTNENKERPKSISQTPSKPAHQERLAQTGGKGAQGFSTPQKMNEKKERPKSISQTPSKPAHQERLAHTGGKGAQRLSTPQKMNEKKERPKSISQTPSKAHQVRFAQTGGERAQGLSTPQKMNENKERPKSISQTASKAHQERLAQTGGKGARGHSTSSLQGNRQETPDVTALQNLSFHQAKDLYRSTSLGINSQQKPNKTPASQLKISPHPHNRQKQKSPVQETINSWNTSENDLEKENINFFTDLPEKKKTPEKQSGLWLTSGSPRKKTPLKENESDSQFARVTNSNAFYGKKDNNSGIRVKRCAKRPRLPSSPPTQTPKKYSSFFTTPSATSSLDRFSSKDHSSKRQSTLNNITLQGFSNLGNTCYMNAILQSILGLVPFVQELHNEDILKTVGRSSLYSCMHHLYRCKNDDGSSREKRDALRRLKGSIKKSEMTKRFSGHLQNDAHEFMNICFDQMKEEIKQALTEEDIAAKVCPVVRNFEGCLRKYIRCKGCKDVVTKNEVFDHLSLNILRSHSSRELSLTKLLGNFFQAEELVRTCDKCNSNNAVQYLKIQTLPRVIILHLLRSEFDQDRGTLSKNSNRINVDRFLEIGRFCDVDVSGPAPFVPRKTSLLQAHPVADNETPFSDDDFVVKSRRRLNMSAAVDSESSDKDAKNSDVTPSKSKKKFPDWVYTQAKRPTLARFDDSSDDDDIEKAKLASLRELQQQQQKLSEDDQIELAKLASLQEGAKRTNIASHDGDAMCDREAKQIERATFASLHENVTLPNQPEEKHALIENDDEVAVDKTQHKRARTQSLEENQKDFGDEVQPITTQRYNSGNGHADRQVGLDEELDDNTRTTETGGQDTGTCDKRQAVVPSGTGGLEIRLAEKLGLKSHGSDDERIRQAVIASQEQTNEEELESYFASSDECGVSNDLATHVDSNPSFTTKSKASQKLETPENICSQNDKHCFEKKILCLLDSDVSLTPNPKDTAKRDLVSDGEATEQYTPSKRRKVDENQTDKAVDMDIGYSYDEEIAMKKALEMSKIEHEQSVLEEESQLEEALRISREDAAMKDAVLNEDPTQEIPIDTNGGTMTSLDENNENSYGLVSVVSHVGSSTSAGHYISDVYDIAKNQWTRYDDITAKEITERDVRYAKGSDGYIYFYMHKSCINKLLTKMSEQ